MRDRALSGNDDSLVVPDLSNEAGELRGDGAAGQASLITMARGSQVTAHRRQLEHFSPSTVAFSHLPECAFLDFYSVKEAPFRAVLAAAVMAVG